MNKGEPLKDCLADHVLYLLVPEVRAIAEIESVLCNNLDEKQRGVVIAYLKKKYIQDSENAG